MDAKVETEVAAWSEYTEKVIDPSTKLGKDVAVERRKLLEVCFCFGRLWIFCHDVFVFGTVCTLQRLGRW